MIGISYVNQPRVCCSFIPCMFTKDVLMQNDQTMCLICASLMHQSFVTTSSPPTGKFCGPVTFHFHCSGISPSFWGQAGGYSHALSPTLHNRKFHGTKDNSTHALVDQSKSYCVKQSSVVQAFKIGTSIKLHSVITYRSLKSIHTELTLIFYQQKKIGTIVMFNHVCWTHILFL